MKRLIVSTLALGLVLSSPALARSADPATEARIRADVTFLADDALEGRKAGQRGYDLAALYVQSRMQALGLSPGGADGSWTQPVTFAVTRVAEPGATATWTPTGGAQVTWTHGRELLISPSAEAGQATTEGDLVFVGYGLDSPAHGLNDYAGLDVTGKIVVALAGVPAGLSSEVAAHLGQGQRATAAAHGAIGLIVINTEATAPQRTPAQFQRQAGRSETNWAPPAGGVHPTAAIRGRAIVSDEVATALFQGAARAYAEVRSEAAAAGTHPRGFPLAGRMRLDVTTSRDEFRSANVIGLIPGSDPALRDEVVMLTAHLDGLGVAAQGEDRVNNGAMDNAGGVSIMLEAARQLMASPPRRSVMVVAITAEEAGLLGSDYLARHPVTARGRLVANVNLDMPILTYDFTDLAAFGSDHSTLGPVVERVARERGVRLSPDPMPEQGVFTRSDHYPFVRQGVPAVMLATGYADGGEAEWGKFFAGGYHSPADDLSQAFKWNAAVRFADINAAIARAIADADERPLWYRGDVFGDWFAPDAPKAAPPSTE